jgi:hypothetical protein
MRLDEITMFRILACTAKGCAASLAKVWQTTLGATKSSTAHPLYLALALLPRPPCYQ